MDLETITPLEIRNKDFPKAFRGYKVSEVLEYLSQIAEIIEKNNQEIGSLKSKLKETETKLQKLESKNKLIEQTLIMAESVKNDTIKNAENKAANIIQRARLEGEEIINKAISTSNKKITEAKNYLHILEHNYINLKEKRKTFVSEFSAKMSALLELLDKDFQPDTLPEEIKENLILIEKRGIRETNQEDKDALQDKRNKDDG